MMLRLRTRLGMPVTRGLVGLVLVTSFIAACGIPQDSEPREISRDALPQELVDPAATQSTLEGDADSRMVTLFLIDASDREVPRLVAVSTEISRPANTGEIPRSAVEALLAARPAEVARPELVNALSSSIEVRSATLGDDDILDLDLSDLGGSEIAMQRLAIAQLVFTLTELDVPRIDGVRFSVDGDAVAVPVAAGVVPAGTPVRARDYPSLVR